MRAIRGMRGVIAVLWAVIQSIPACWGLPAVQSHSVTPSELRAGLGYQVDVYTSSDVTSMIVQVDLRPTSSQVFRLVPTVGSSGPGGKRWTAVGQVPADLHPAPGAEATFRVIAMDALRSQVRVNFTEPLLGVRVDCQLGPWENTGVCDMTTGKELWRRPVLVPAQYGGAECAGPTEEWRDSWRIEYTDYFEPIWWGCVDGIEEGTEGWGRTYINCAGGRKYEETWYQLWRPCPCPWERLGGYLPSGPSARNGCVSLILSGWVDLDQVYRVDVLEVTTAGGKLSSGCDAQYSLCVTQDDDGRGNAVKLGVILCDEWGSYWPSGPDADNGCVSHILVRAGKSLEQVHRIDVLEVTWAGGKLSQGCDAQYDYCLLEADDGRGNAVKLGVVEKQDCEGHWESSIEWGACDSNCVRRGVKHWNWVTTREPRNGGQLCPQNYDEPVEERCRGWIEAPGFYLEGWVLYSGGPKGGVWVDLDGSTYTAWNGEIRLPTISGHRIELQFEGGNKAGRAWYTPGQGSYVPQQKDCP